MHRGLSFVPFLVASLLCALPGCHLILPEVTHQPLVHNPFPQFSRVAVAPFFNQSDEPTVDGRDFALAYYAELQTIPGFEVVPLGVVEEAILAHRIDLSNPEEARRLARTLGVDAVVIGSVTDYSPYYPPRCGMRVEWYSANPGFHEIPAGYGLPWGTAEEEYIPEELVFEAEMALARAQMATQSPPMPEEATASGTANDQPAVQEPRWIAPDVVEPLPAPPAEAHSDSDADQALFQSSSDGVTTASEKIIAPSGATGLDGGIPPDWPDARGFLPPGPSPMRPTAMRHEGPVMTHTRIYQGHDPEFTAALASYVSFRDEARFGGWRSYLERSDDFIRFCAHLHLAEMLTARGGGGETRVVRRWSESR